jgi:hypothetical protein
MQMLHNIARKISIDKQKQPPYTPPHRRQYLINKSNDYLVGITAKERGIAEIKQHQEGK